MYTQLNSSRLGDPGTPITVTARWSPFVVIDDTASSRPSATHGQPSCLPGGLAVAPPPPGTTLGLRHPKWVPRAESPKGARGGGSCLCLPPPPEAGEMLGRELRAGRSRLLAPGGEGPTGSALGGEAGTRPPARAVGTNRRGWR